MALMPAQREQRWIDHLVSHLNQGRKFIIRSDRELSRGYVIPFLENDDGERWPQPFVVVRETTAAEFFTEMRPFRPMRILAQVRYWEVMVD